MPSITRLILKLFAWWRKSFAMLGKSCSPLKCHLNLVVQPLTSDKNGGSPSDTLKCMSYYSWEDMPSITRLILKLFAWWRKSFAMLGKSCSPLKCHLNLVVQPLTSDKNGGSPSNTLKCMSYYLWDCLCVTGTILNKNRCWQGRLPSWWRVILWAIVQPLHTIVQYV